MATTGLPQTSADLPRVTESLTMISPRWSVWVLMTLSAQPLRYTQIKTKLPWLADGQLHPRLRKLTDAGLVERTQYASRHVTYGLTERGADLMPVLTVIAAWGNTHLDKDIVLNQATGEHAPEHIAPAQNIEDTLALLTPRHATAILWTLQARGATSAKSLAAVALPDYGLSAIYPPLRQLTDDGLVESTGAEATFQLSAHGLALAPLYRSMSAWAAGRPLADADHHPVWGQDPAPSRTEPGTWITNQSRLSAAPASTPAAPVLPAQPPVAKWKAGDLFSHRIPARTVAPAGGHGR